MKNLRPAPSSSVSPPARGPSSSMAMCTPDGVCFLRNVSASSYDPLRSSAWSGIPDRPIELSSRRCREDGALAPAPAPRPPSSSSSPSAGATNLGLTPSCAVGRKNGAFGSGFGGSTGLFRSLTKSRCSVAIHLAAGTSDRVISSGSSGLTTATAGVFADGARGVPPASPFSSSGSSSSPGSPGSSTSIGVVGSGRSKGADREGSKRNLFAQTWTALPFECEVRRNAELGEKQRLSAGFANTKASMHLAAGRSKMRSPPSRRAAASHLASGVKAMSVAGTPQVKVRTTAFPCRSTTSRPPSSKDAATSEPCARSSRQLGEPGRLPFNSTDATASCVIRSHTFTQQSRGCEAAVMTCPETLITTPQTRPRWACSGGPCFLALPVAGSTWLGGFGMGPRWSEDCRLKRCRAPFSSPTTQ
mmetsp:Transcript_100727/g.285488  ORF Transcript_100727/g.285488 Transcript_100727/m.285488 type:complete len:417 (-) Transcript_100727:1622-2872(-)